MVKCSIAVTFTGLAGLLLGGIAFPGSNLLGGFSHSFWPDLLDPPRGTVRKDARRGCGVNREGVATSYDINII